MEQEQCKTQQNNCEKMWTKDIKRLEERFTFTDKALKIQDDEIKRRMKEANDIKHEFSKMMGVLQVQVSTLEARNALWLKMVAFGLGFLQVVIAIIFKVWK